LNVAARALSKTKKSRGLCPLQDAARVPARLDDVVGLHIVVIVFIIVGGGTLSSVAMTWVADDEVSIAASSEEKKRSLAAVCAVAFVTVGAI